MQKGYADETQVTFHFTFWLRCVSVLLVFKWFENSPETVGGERECLRAHCLELYELDWHFIGFLLLFKLWAKFPKASVQERICGGSSSLSTTVTPKTIATLFESTVSEQFCLLLSVENLPVCGIPCLTLVESIETVTCWQALVDGNPFSQMNGRKRWCVRNILFLRPLVSTILCHPMPSLYTIVCITSTTLWTAAFWTFCELITNEDFFYTLQLLPIFGNEV